MSAPPKIDEQTKALQAAATAVAAQKTPSKTSQNPAETTQKSGQPPVPFTPGASGYARPTQFNQRSPYPRGGDGAKQGGQYPQSMQANGPPMNVFTGYVRFSLKR